MARVIADELEVCEDCAQSIANGEGTDELSRRQVALWGADAWGLVLACGDEDEDTCPTFSTRPCDGCGSTLAGSRHLAAVLAND